MKKFPYIIITIILIVLFGCNLPIAGGPKGNQVPAALASFGNLASVHSSPISIKVNDKASVTQLGDGVTLQVPAGAFSSPNTLHVTQVEVAFNKIAYDVKQSPFYVISSQIEVGTLSAPVILEVPKPTTNVTVVRYDGQNWQSLQVTPGQTTRVEITHFSDEDLGFIDWYYIGSLMMQAQNPVSNEFPSRFDPKTVEQGDKWTMAFFGVADGQPIDQKEYLCNTIKTLLAQFNTPENRTFPDNWQNNDLATYLSEASPSTTGGYFYDITKDSMDKINNAVLASKKELSPADLLKISMNANGGNIPLGVLAASNYLNEIRYQGEQVYQPGKPFPQKWGEPVDNLMSWRTTSNITPYGRYDKIGPLVDLFASMTSALWLPTAPGNIKEDVATNDLLFLAKLRANLINNTLDPERIYADQCGADAAIWLRDNPPTNAQTQPSSNATPANASVADCDATQWIQVKYDTPDIISGTNNITGTTYYSCNERIHFIFTYSDPNRGVSINIKVDRALTGSIFSGWPQTGMGWEPGGDTNVIQYRVNYQDTGYVAHDFYLAYTAFFDDIKDSINSGVRCEWIGNNIEASGIKILPLDNACK